LNKDLLDLRLFHRIARSIDVCKYKLEIVPPELLRNGIAVWF
jgi:hypothetical protein